jgi:hypothetical protein
MGVVQKILRHSDITVTEGVYGHLDSDDVRRALAKMPVRGVEELARPAPVFRPGREVARNFAADFAAKSLSGKSKGRTQEENPLEIRPFVKSGRQDSNLRPLGPESGSPAFHAQPGIACAAKLLIFLHRCAARSWHRSHAAYGNCRP